MGTVIQFTPVIETDAVEKTGIIHSIGVKYHCITCMKEYEAKSLEQLRWEDYQCNRKSSQQSNIFGASALTSPTVFGRGAEIGRAANYANQHLNQQLSFAKPNCSLGAAPNSFPFKTTTPLFGANLVGKLPLLTINAPTAAGVFTGNLLHGQQNMVQNPTGTFCNKSSLQPLITFGQPSTVQSSPKTPLSSFPTFGGATPTTNVFSPTVQPLKPNYGFGSPPASNSISGTKQEPSTFSNFLAETELQLPRDYHTFVDQVFDCFPHRDFLEDVSAKNYLNRDGACTNTLALSMGAMGNLPTPVTPACNIKNLRTMLVSTNRSNDLSKFALLNNVVRTNRMPLIHSSRKNLVLTKVAPRSEKVCLEEYEDTSAAGDSEHWKSSIVDDRSQSITGDKKENNSRDTGKAAAATTIEATEKPTFKSKDFDCSIESQSSDNLQLLTDTNETDNTLLDTETNISGEFEEVNQKQNSTRRCGVKLSRPEYYTVPPLDEIDNYYATETGVCLVKGFTIGRFGYGNVHYSDQTNIANLDLDEIVHFRHQEITVYPDDTKKPPLGEGLNKPAQVTLDNVWPRHPETKHIVKNLEELAEMKFIDRLRLLSDKQNVQFLDYRPETGSWVFVVKHFSAVYFTNDNEEESEITLESVY